MIDQLGILENFVWLFPALSQRGKRLSFYFYILGGAGFVELIFLLNHRSLFADEIAFFVSALTVYLLFENKRLRKWRYCFIALLLGVTTTAYFKHFGRFELYLFLLSRVVILGVFLKQLISDSLIKQQFNLFLVCLVLYELSIVLRIGFALTQTQVGLYYYLVSMSFETMLGIFFTLFREDSRGIRLKIGKAV